MSQRWSFPSLWGHHADLVESEHPGLRPVPPPAIWLSGFSRRMRPVMERSLANLVMLAAERQRRKLLRPRAERIDHDRQDCKAEIFERRRRSMTGVAYRITGSWTDAGDIGQDVWLRSANAHSDVDKPRNWLLRVTVRASLDRLRRLKRRRETYLGLAPGTGHLARIPGRRGARRRARSGCSWCRRACPARASRVRASGGVRVGFEDIAEALGRSPDTVRQLARRGHRHVGRARPRFAVDERRAAEGTERFLRACLDGNIELLLRVLSPDVVMYTDGGSEAPAPKRALVGAREVLSFLAGLGRKNAFADATFTLPCQHGPGITTRTEDQVLSASTFDYDRSAGSRRSTSSPHPPSSPTSPLPLLQRPGMTKGPRTAVQGMSLRANASGGPRSRPTRQQWRCRR